MNDKQLISKMVEIARRKAKKRGLNPIEEMGQAIEIVANKKKWNDLEKQAKKELNESP